MHISTDNLCLGLVTHWIGYTNPSDQFPISMTIKWNYHQINNTDNTAIRGKTKWDKVDKDLYIMQLMATK